MRDYGGQVGPAGAVPYFLISTILVEIQSMGSKWLNGCCFDDVKVRSKMGFIIVSKAEQIKENQTKSNQTR
jgi:hypothetical protein